MNNYINYKIYNIGDILSLNDNALIYITKIEHSNMIYYNLYNYYMAGGVIRSKITYETFSSNFQYWKHIKIKK